MSGRESEVEGSESEFSVDPEDQLQPEDTLVDRGVDDILDEGTSPPEKPLGIDKFGVTAAEQREGESLDQRLSEEVADVGADDQDSAAGQVDITRTGRLIDAAEGVGSDVQSELVAGDAGVAGGAAGAEESAVHDLDEG